MTPDDREYVRFIGEGHVVSCMGLDDNNTKWLRPDGLEVNSRKRVYVENINGQSRLIFDKVKREDQGKWTCINDDNEGSGKNFIMNVYGELNLRT